MFSDVVMKAQTHLGFGRDLSTLISKKLVDRLIALRKELLADTVVQYI